jgi:hypothetical protein
MSKSSRRVVQTTVAVVGMAAVGAVGSGTAFAQTAADLDRTPEGVGHTDLAGVEDGLGAAEEVGGDLYSFQLPALGDQSVKNSHHLAKKKDKDSDDEDSDDEDSDDDKDKKKDSDKDDDDKDKKSKSKKDKDDDKDDKGGKHRKKD